MNNHVYRSGSLKVSLLLSVSKKKIRFKKHLCYISFHHPLRVSVNELCTRNSNLFLLFANSHLRPPYKNVMSDLKCPHPHVDDPHRIRIHKSEPLANRWGAMLSWHACGVAVPVVIVLRDPVHSDVLSLTVWPHCRISCKEPTVWSSRCPAPWLCSPLLWPEPLFW